MSDIPLGRFCWYELMSKDPNGSKAFYTELVGWASEPFPGGGDTPYDLWLLDQTPIGGLMALPEEAQKQGAPTHWLPYVSTPNTDASAEKASALGGTVMVAPQDIPGVGRFAVLKDPQGAMFAVYTPAGETPGHDGARGVGEFSWHELATTDYAQAFAFYQQLFGWHKTDDMDMGPHGIYRMYGRLDDTLGGMFNKTAEMPVVAWLLYISISDIEAAVAKVKTLGGRVLNGPMEVPGGDLIAQCIDAQGGTFALHMKKAAG